MTASLLGSSRVERNVLIVCFSKGFFWNDFNALNLQGRGEMNENIREEETPVEKETYEKPELKKKGKIKEITAGIAPTS